jgi:hypothetical protein
MHGFGGYGEHQTSVIMAFWKGTFAYALSKLRFMTIDIQKSRQVELEVPAGSLEVIFFVSSRFSFSITRDNNCDTQSLVNISAVPH